MTPSHWAWTLAFAGLSCLPAGGLGQHGPVTAPASFSGDCIGINLSRIRYWEPSVPFVDVMRCSGPFASSQGSLELRVDGYPARLLPGQQAYTLILSGAAGSHSAGAYRCRWLGQGRIRFGQDAREIESSPGSALLEVTPREGIYLEIQATDPEDPVRRVELVQLADANAETDADEPSASPLGGFDPSFLISLAPFPVVRFLNWLPVNEGSLEHESDRVRESAQTQASEQGVAWETIAQLTNELKADAWICVPHRADDACVRAFAKVLHETLDPERGLYIEYSNETWNGMFEQARECRRRGVAASLDRNEYAAGLKYYAQRSVEVFRLFDDVLHGERRRVRVLATQAANPWTAETVLGTGSCAENADALAIAVYFGGSFGAPESAEATLALSIEEILDRCTEEIEGPLRALVQRNREIAAAHDLPLISYEGGAHLVGVGPATENRALTDLLHAANRHPRMEQVYDHWIAMWRSETDGPLLAYSHLTRYDKYGAFGHLEQQGQDPSRAPKYRALLRAIEARSAGR